MGKISQTVAHDAAVKVCKPLKAEKDAKKKEMGEYIRSLIVAETPKEVLVAYSKSPEYIKECTTIKVEGVGVTRYVYVSWEEKVAVKNTSSYQVDSKTSIKFNKLHDEYTKLEEKYRKTVEDIENTILAIGTHKRIEEQYPEIYPYIAEKPTTQAVILNIAPIRELTCALIPGCKKTVKK